MMMQNKRKQPKGKGKKLIGNLIGLNFRTAKHITINNNMKTISISNQINFWRNARKEAIERDAPINQIENNPSDKIAQLERLVKQLRKQKSKN